MQLKPPPIQEPLILDSMGRISSPAWIYWLQELISTGNAEALFSDYLTLQSTDTNGRSSRTSEVNQDDLAVLIMMSY